MAEPIRPSEGAAEDFQAEAQEATGNKRGVRSKGAAIQEEQPVGGSVQQVKEPAHE